MQCLKKLGEILNCQDWPERNHRIVPSPAVARMLCSCRWEELAAKYSISLDWDTVAKDVVLPAETAEESKVLNGDASASAAAFEAVEQKLRDSKAHRRSELSQLQSVTSVTCRSVLFFQSLLGRCIHKKQTTLRLPSTRSL